MDDMETVDTGLAPAVARLAPKRADDGDWWPWPTPWPTPLCRNVRRTEVVVAWVGGGGGSTAGDRACRQRPRRRMSSESSMQHCTLRNEHCEHAVWPRSLRESRSHLILRRWQKSHDSRTMPRRRRMLGCLGGCVLVSVDVFVCGLVCSFIDLLTAVEQWELISRGDGDADGI